MSCKFKKVIIFVITLSLILVPVTASAASKKSSNPKSVNKVIKVAKSKLHCKYRYGAESGNAFDCSGFVYYVYKKSHVPLKKKVKRSSCQGLYKSLKKYVVSRSLTRAKKGDIILYKNGKRYTHAAISLGKGKIIHAANPRKGVCIAKAKQIKHNRVAVIRIIK